VTDDDTRHSGSRWEPTPASASGSDSAAAPDLTAGEAGTERIASPTPSDPTPSDPNGAAVTDRVVLPAAHHEPRPWPVLPAVPLGGSAPSAPRRRNLRRAGLLAAAAAGLLAVGGAGGYAIGNAAAGSDPAGAAGLAGAPGEYGHHRGQFGADGGVPGDRDGDGSVGDGSVDGGRVSSTAPDGAGSTGTGTTGTST
jgi:hypothetical protein